MRQLLKGFFMSLSMFSVIPLPKIWDPKAFHWVVPSLPMVGLVIGFLWYGMARTLIYFNVPLMLKAALILLFPAMLSGFIHLDGYMDTSDAIFSRAELSKKQEILKDPHVGAFAAIMLGIYLLIGFAAVYSVLEAAAHPMVFIFIPVLSRSLAGLMLLTVKPMKSTGFGAMFRENTKPSHVMMLLFVLILTMLIGWLVGDPPVVYSFLVLIIGGTVVGGYTVKQLGGISGDLCGCIITVSEVLAFIALAVIRF